MPKPKRKRSRKHVLIKTKLLLQDNGLALAMLMLWFAFGFVVYRFSHGLPPWDAMRASLFLKHMETDFSDGYTMWTQGIIFGVVFSLLHQNIMEKYNPERSCRMIARELRDHVVVLGYSHLGRRLVNHFRENGVSYCVIERDRNRVDELLRDGEPVVVDDARDYDALHDANVPDAKAVLIASNNLETALLVTKRVRESNAECAIVVRCYQDDFVEILETLGANEVISSSKNAFEDIISRVEM